VNQSINQTLSRTLITSGLTWLVVVALFLLGGEVLRGFAFVLMIGILVGTYSSIFIASPIVIFWERMFAKKAAPEGSARARARA
jgi:preprotein translocase subunit SecF